MNETALHQINMVINTYSDIIKGIFAVKGSGHNPNSMAGKINIDDKQNEYANKLRLLFMILTNASQQFGQKELDKIIFEVDNYLLILRKIKKTKGKIPLFISVITEKTKDIQNIDMIIDEMAEELLLLLC